MLSIFRPTHLGCPVCNKDSKRHSLYEILAHKKLTEDQYEGHLCRHKFSPFEALYRGCHGIFGVLNTFSHWQWSSEETVVVGSLLKLPVTIPADIKPFAAFLTPYTPSDGPQVHYVPQVLEMNGPELLISTAGSLGTPPEQLGTRMRLMVGIYGFCKPETRGWARLLYESLTEYSMHRYSVAIFKLATSLEIACERATEAYLASKGVGISLIQLILRDARNWPARLGRIREIVPVYLSPIELEAFEKSARLSEEKVRRYRNAFAHDDPATPDHRAAEEAFKTSFPLLWGIDRMLTASK
ncbi:MAG: hypothetical protein AB7L09_16320 [Nitrospira sp.]